MPSIHSKTAGASSAWQAHVERSRSSRCMVDQSDSIIVSSALEATRPLDPSGPAERSRWPTIHDVDWLLRSKRTIAPGAGWRRQMAICGASRQFGAHVVGDRTPDDPAGGAPQPVWSDGGRPALDEVLVRRGQRCLRR